MSPTNFRATLGGIFVLGVFGYKDELPTKFSSRFKAFVILVQKDEHYWFAVSVKFSEGEMQVSSYLSTARGAACQ